MPCRFMASTAVAIAVVFLPGLLNIHCAGVHGKNASATSPVGKNGTVSKKLPVSGEKPIDGWRLKQRSKLDAATEVLLTHDAVRIKVLKSGLIVVSRKPWKQVSYYSLGTRKISTVPFDRAVYPYLTAIHLTSGGDLSNLKLVQAGQKNIVGIDCKYYRESESTRRLIASYVTHGEMAGMAPLQVEFLTSDEFKVSPEVGRLISQYCSLPRLEGVPMRLIAKTFNGGSRTEIDTLSCERAKFSAVDFDVPPGLISTGSPANVLVSDEGDKETIDLMMPR